MSNTEVVSPGKTVYSNFLKIIICELHRSNFFILKISLRGLFMVVCRWLSQISLLSDSMPILENDPILISYINVFYISSNFGHELF